MEEAIGYEVAAEERSAPLSLAGAETLRLERQVQALKGDRSRLLYLCTQAWGRLGELAPGDPLVARLNQLTDEIAQKVLLGS